MLLNNQKLFLDSWKTNLTNIVPRGPRQPAAAWWLRRRRRGWPWPWWTGWTGGWGRWAWWAWCLYRSPPCPPQSCLCWPQTTWTLGPNVNGYFLLENTFYSDILPALQDLIVCVCFSCDCGCDCSDEDCSFQSEEWIHPFWFVSDPGIQHWICFRETFIESDRYIKMLMARWHFSEAGCFMLDMTWQTHITKLGTIALTIFSRITTCLHSLKSQTLVNGCLSAVIDLLRGYRADKETQLPLIFLF